MHHTRFQVINYAFQKPNYVGLIYARISVNLCKNVSKISQLKHFIFNKVNIFCEVFGILLLKILRSFLLIIFEKLITF